MTGAERGRLGADEHGALQRTTGETCTVGATSTSGQTLPHHAHANMRVVKHSIVIAGHRTSVSLEDAFWRALKEMAAREGLSLAALAARIDATRGAANLSSALRVFALENALRAGELKSD